MDRLLTAKRALRYIVCLLVAVVAGVAAGKEGAATEAGVQTAAGTAGTNACCTADNYRAAVLAWACAKTNHSGAQKTRLYTEAINRFSHIEVGHPDSPDAPKALFNQAVIFERIRSMAEVLAAYDKLLVRYPDSALAPEALARMGQRLLREAMQDEQDSEAALENETVRSTVVFIRPEPFREGKPRAPP
ncbi:MAG: tetratricopeptide repeat protein [Kiritimatiellia bacterium]